DWSPGANEAFSFSYAIVGDDWVDPGAEPSGEPSGEPSSEPSDEQSVDTETELSVEASKVGCGCQSNQVPLTSTVGFLASLMIWSRRRRLDDEQYLSI
ncbi:MAG: MYXO-CTERM sorting domain-containing protein, partial [Myxococcota bacterium]|nr:MYXO-CTERM sorting domain-containing protein [Myxococcota bacterium]